MSNEVEHKGRVDWIGIRKQLALKLEELLGYDETLNLYHDKLDPENIKVTVNNGDILTVADTRFKMLFERVDFNKNYEAKAERYKYDFKRAYEQCKAAVKSNGNISLNTSMVGVMGPIYSPERSSNGYSVYNSLKFSKQEIYKLDKEYFNNIKDYKEEYITINEVSKAIYGLKLKPKDSNGTLGGLDDGIEEHLYSRNKILFGPPGTGKSYNIKNKMNLINVKPDNIIRITFHPEYSYYEFMGQYKPVVGYEKIVGEVIYPNNSQPTNEKAFVYYDFVPGPFTKAIINALKLSEQVIEEVPENALLIIEEINRGNSSAIFGDIFQLLDRVNDVDSESYGESEYSVDISVEMKEYIKQELKWTEENWNEKFKRGFIIPSNLYIYSTMNTSDQSLYPMDSAFKRRWDMEYMYINYREEKLNELYLPKPYSNIRWLDFIKKANKEIVNYTDVDDKQIGQWFVGNRLSESEFIGKVISYLWFDIFRYDPQLLFKEKIQTFDDVRSFYKEGIFNSEIIKNENLITENEDKDDEHE